MNFVPKLSPPPRFRRNNLESCATCKYRCHFGEWYNKINPPKHEISMDEIRIQTNLSWYEVVCNDWEAIES